MMKSLYFGQCEECGKWYLVHARKTNNDGAVRCPHCKKWSQNWNDSLWSVADFIKQLKRFPQKAPIFFAADRDKPAPIYQWCTVETDALQEIVLIRPDGDDLDEDEMSKDLDNQP